MGTNEDLNISTTRCMILRSAASSAAVTSRVFWSGSTFHTPVSPSNWDASHGVFCANASEGFQVTSTVRSRKSG